MAMMFDTDILSIPQLDIRALIEIETVWPKYTDGIYQCIMYMVVMKTLWWWWRSL
jgi:hypothetical protein